MWGVNLWQSLYIFFWCETSEARLLQLQLHLAERTQRGPPTDRGGCWDDAQATQQNGDAVPLLRSALLHLDQQRLHTVLSALPPPLELHPCTLVELHTMSAAEDSAAEERRKRAQARKDKISSRGADRLAKITGAAKGEGAASERFGTGGTGRSDSR